MNPNKLNDSTEFMLKFTDTDEGQMPPVDIETHEPMKLDLSTEENPEPSQFVSLDDQNANENNSRKKIEISHFAIGPKVSKRTVDTLTKLSDIKDAAAQTAPTPLEFQCPREFISDGASKGELQRLAAGVWCVAKHVMLPVGPCVVVGIVLLSSAHPLNVVEGAMRLASFDISPWVEKRLEKLQESEFLNNFQEMPEGLQVEIQKLPYSSEIRLILI